MGNPTFSSLKSSQDLPYPVPESFSRLVQKSANGTLQKLAPYDCISEYASYYQTKYGSLVLIMENLNMTNSNVSVRSPERIWTDDFVLLIVERVMDSSANEVPYAWMCDNSLATITERQNCPSKISEMSQMQSLSNDWKVHGRKVNYCLAEALPQTCTLEFSFSLALIVIIANLVKVIVIGVTASHLKRAPLLTTGDAVASFIKRPDEVTKCKYLLSRGSVSGSRTEDDQLRYNEKPRRWRSSLSAQRWTACFLSYVLCP